MAYTRKRIAHTGVRYAIRKSGAGYNIVSSKTHKSVAHAKSKGAAKRLRNVRLAIDHGWVPPSQRK